MAWAANAPLEQARARADDLDYAGALKLLDGALEVPNNERQALLDIYELQGVCWATLGKTDKAMTAFKTLLVLDPAHTLAGAQPPRVKTPFYEAKEWAAKAGPVQLLPAPEKRGDVVESLTVTVPKDGLNLARGVAVHAVVSGEPVDARAALSDTTRSATVKIDAKGFKWWAEVTGDRGAVLLRLGTHDAPNVVEAPKDVPVAVPIAPQPQVQQQAQAPRGTGQRVAGALIGGAGVAAAGVGIVLGALSVDARSQIANATKDDQGNVVGITQRKAADLDAQARSFGLAGNILMIGGGVVAATGLVVLITAPSDSVAVAPAPGGVTVSGRF
jgi:hypothetical protein